MNNMNSSADLMFAYSNYLFNNNSKRENDKNNGSNRNIEERIFHINFENLSSNNTTYSKVETESKDFEKMGISHLTDIMKEKQKGL
ncbi:MAG: hypothetical protein HQK51_02625 [Oligoflexia bacterium]|nr:hypothetical protein [Oligoflexia bacterium]